MGEWHSDAVFLYVTVPLTIRLQSVNVIAKAMLNNNSSTQPPPQFGFGAQFSLFYILYGMFIINLVSVKAVLVPNFACIYGLWFRGSISPG